MNLQNIRLSEKKPVAKDQIFWFHLYAVSGTGNP